MAKEPARRYASAAALRDDLERFLDNRPILGRPVSAWERARSWARRRPAVAALLALVVLLVCGLIGGIAAWASWLGWHNRQLEIQVARADRQTREAEAQHRIAEERRRLSDRHHYAESLRRARQALDARQIELAQDILHDIQPDLDGVDPRGFAWHRLWCQATREFCQLWGHKASVSGGAVAPDGDSLATVDTGRDRADLGPSWLRVSRPFQSHLPHGTRSRTSLSSRRTGGTWRSDWCSPRRRHRGSRSSMRPRVATWPTWWSTPAMESVLPRSTTSVGYLKSSFTEPVRRCLKVCDLANPSQAPRTRRLGDHGATTELSPDGRLLAVRRQGQVVLEDPLTGNVLTVLDGSITAGLDHHRFSADRRFFTGVAQSELLVWETDNGRRIGQTQVKRPLMAIEPGSRGRYVAWMEDDGRVGVLEPATGRAREFIAGSESRRLRSGQIVISSDETVLAFRQHWHPGGPRSAEVWNLAIGRRTAVFPGRDEDGSIWFIPGRHDLLVANVSGPRIWRPDPPTVPDAVAGHSAEAWAAAFSPDGKVLATGSDDTHERQTIKLWDRRTGHLLAGWKGHTATVAALAFSPNGSLLASGSLDSGSSGHPNVLLWDVTSHQRLASLEGHTDRVRSVAFSPDGQWLATASDDMTARLWDVLTKTARAVLTGHTKNLTSISFSSDGRLLASASNDRTVRIWDVATGQARAILPEVSNVNGVAFAPDGSLAASANEGGEIKLWDPTRGDLVRTIRGEAGQLRCLAFTPDGRNIVAAGKGKVIRIWDVATGQELLSLEGHKTQINALAFTPDGSVLASCSHDGAVRLWHAGPIDPLLLR